ncbi:MAG: septal ring lytic transglycosylase RlpA family protein, partial [Alphaproteobacteria bacterium]|nr:septal ring lytic transglycosylase RlpA family protein [Alphaproteobacteria bacterium]
MQNIITYCKKHTMANNPVLLRGFLAALLCASIPACTWDTSPSTSGAAPSPAPHYKVGDPYKVNNKWYYPKEDYSYDETGIASWYGDPFHNKLTANGELYNKQELTAAHTTLPLPSLARVTNLENGRSIVVRVNDRGPFIGNRIIDLSERSADLLGFKSQGTAKVRVQVLADESKAIADAMRRYGTPAQYATAQEQIQIAAVESSTSVYEEYSS